LGAGRKGANQNDSAMFHDFREKQTLFQPKLTF